MLSKSRSAIGNLARFKQRNETERCRYRDRPGLHWSWVGAIAATLAVTSLIIKFNWHDKLEKAPTGGVRREQPLPAQTTTP